MRILSNILLYQLIWFICVLGENRYVWLVAILLAVHLCFSEKRAADLKVMAVLLIAGTAIDGALTISGFFRFNVGAYPIPLWLSFLWLGLATLPHHSLSWLKPRPLLSSVFGALGGPLAYWAGVRLGAASFTAPLLPSLLTLALIWAILWPYIMRYGDMLLSHRDMES